LALSWSIGGSAIGWRTLPFVLAGMIAAVLPMVWLAS